MHALVLVVVPGSVADVAGFVTRALERHRRVEGDQARGRWDYYLIGGRWDGASATRGAPGTVANNTTPIAELTRTSGLLPQCYAIIIADEWHDCTQLDSEELWLRRCEALFRDCADGVVVAVDAHV